MKLFPTYKIKIGLVVGSVGGRLMMHKRLYLCSDERREWRGKSCGRSRTAAPLLRSRFRRTRLAAPLTHRRGSDAALQPLVWTSPTRSGSSGSGGTQKRCACLSDCLDVRRSFNCGDKLLKPNIKPTQEKDNPGRLLITLQKGIYVDACD